MNETLFDGPANPNIIICRPTPDTPAPDSVSVPATVKRLKEEQQDFEWYPTTDEILRRIQRDLPKPYAREGDPIYSGSLLDIGAGDARVLNALTTGDKYAIEKSRVLIERYPADIFIIGTDFLQQTLIDKQVDTIFCNPPYSEFEQWADKIIREANAHRIYLVLPDRWATDARKALIELREGTYKVLGKYDFENAERKARCKVELIKIDLLSEGYHSSDTIKTDPFEIWFNENFKIQADQAEDLNGYNDETRKKERLQEMIGTSEIIPNLEALYREDLEKLISHYRALEDLDPELLKELNINLAGACEGLKLKIKGLKYVYWNTLFDNMTMITDRLTSKSREKLLNTLTANTSIDFSTDNAYSVIIWVIKNANQYMHDQLCELYHDMADKKNVTLYKSNHRILDDGWRYNKQDMTHYKLDYRIIHDVYNCFGDYGFNQDRLNDGARTFLEDIMTVARNLDFQILGGYHMPRNRAWCPGTREEFLLQDGDLFCDVKCYKNGNIHIRFMPDFMKAFNVEAARLHNWISSPEEAKEEFNLTEKEAQRFYQANYQLEASSLPMLEQSKDEN